MTADVQSFFVDVGVGFARATAAFAILKKDKYFCENTVKKIYTPTLKKGEKSSIANFNFLAADTKIFSWQIP